MVFMQKRSPRKSLAGSGITEAAKPDARQYTQKTGKMLVEALQPEI